MVTIVFVAIAAGATLLTVYLAQPPAFKVWLLLTNLTGTALLASALVPNDQILNYTPRGLWNWLIERRFASMVGFNKPEFYLGLVLLALSAILSTLS